MSQRKVRVIDADGNASWMKLRRVREHQAAFAGKFNSDGVYVFPLRHRSADPQPLMPPNLLPLVSEALPYVADAADSGFAGFLRYPMPRNISGRGIGLAARYPVLARAGAGLG